MEIIRSLGWVLSGICTYYIFKSLPKIKKEKPTIVERLFIVWLFSLLLSSFIFMGTTFSKRLIFFVGWNDAAERTLIDDCTLQLSRDYDPALSRKMCECAVGNLRARYTRYQYIYLSPVEQGSSWTAAFETCGGAAAMAVPKGAVRK